MSDNIEGLEDLKLSDLAELRPVGKMKYSDALIALQNFRDEHNLDDRQALSAFKITQSFWHD